MSKYPFFAKKGRPSDAERHLCKKINNKINSGSISQSDIDEFINSNGIPETQEDLETFYSLLTGEEAVDKKTEIQHDEDVDDYQDYETENDVNNNVSNTPKPDVSSENPINFTPFDEPVIERSYTKGLVDVDVDSEMSGSGGFSDSDSDSDVEFDENDLKRPVEDAVVEEDIPEPSWAGNIGGSTSSTENSESDDSENYDDFSETEKLGGDNLQDLSPAQKRKAAEKTADAILNMYCNFAPLPFKRWSKINETNVQKLVLDDKIDLNMPLEDNVTVKEYIQGVNEQVDEIFTVSDETREEIKDPLIDVLLEQELALTPTQRLLMAVGSHVITMGFSAYQLSQNNKTALETFEKYHQQLKQQQQPEPQRRTSTNTSSQRTRPFTQNDSFNMSDKQAVEELMREMNKGEDDIIDAVNDPNIEITEEYD